MNNNNKSLSTVGKGTNLKTKLFNKAKVNDKMFAKSTAVCHFVI